MARVPMPTTPGFCAECGGLILSFYRRHPVTERIRGSEAWCSECWEFIVRRSARESAAEQVQRTMRRLT